MARSSHTEEPRMGKYCDGGAHYGICGCVSGCGVVFCVVEEVIWGLCCDHRLICCLKIRTIRFEGVGAAKKSSPLRHRVRTSTSKVTFGHFRPFWARAITSANPTSLTAPFHLQIRGRPINSYSLVEKMKNRRPVKKSQCLPSSCGPSIESYLWPYFLVSSLAM